VIGLVRVLTNFELDSKLVLSVVLAGQPALSKMLLRPEHDDVAYRIAHYAQLGLLSRDEHRRYVEHRLTVAGARTPLFDAGAIEGLFEMSRGNLRATDSLALQALDLAARRGIAVVDASMVTEARRWIRP
jgi:general secretion pathway protein A